MISISEDSLYKLWGQPIYHFRDGRDGTTSSYLREQEALLRRPTWWEWTQLEEWGYLDIFNTNNSNNIYREE
jgi:hypothetical protein